MTDQELQTLEDIYMYIDSKIYSDIMNAFDVNCIKYSFEPLFVFSVDPPEWYELWGSKNVPTYQRTD